MNILVSGANGLIGSKLLDALDKLGHNIYILKRNSSGLKKNEIFWDIEKGVINSEQEFDAVFHLAGENVSQRFWTKKQKDRIYQSRIKSTELLVRFLLRQKTKLKFFLCASAVGFYGNRGEESLTEESLAGDGFLANVCKDWEGRTSVLKEAGIRVANARFGLVLGKEGGALAKLILPFKLGLGGRLGSGKQYVSWIAIEDAVNALIFCLVNENISGAVNFVSPHPITNQEFTNELAYSLKRLAILPVPATILKVFLGEMAEELLLSSIKAYPSVLIKNNYQFHFPAVREYFKSLNV